MPWGFQASALTVMQVEERLGPARQSLDALLAEGHAGSFDLAFIGAAAASLLWGGP